MFLSHVSGATDLFQAFFFSSVQQLLPFIKGYFCSSFQFSRIKPEPFLVGIMEVFFLLFCMCAVKNGLLISLVPGEYT